MNTSDITVEKLREACVRLGYAFFERGDYNLNIIGIRSGDTSANTFNDVLRWPVESTTKTGRSGQQSERWPYSRDNKIEGRSWRPIVVEAQAQAAGHLLAWWQELAGKRRKAGEYSDEGGRIQQEIAVIRLEIEASGLTESDRKIL